MFQYFQKKCRSNQDSTRRQNNFEHARRYQYFCWGGGVPHKIKKHKCLVGPSMEDLPNLYFMLIDRYEIHIQAFGDFFTGIS